MTLDRMTKAIKLVEFELQRVDALSQLVEVGSSAEFDELYTLAGDEDDGIEWYAEEVHELDDLRVLFGQLAAVALYSVVEIRTKAALGWKETPAELSQVFKIAKLKQLFQKYSHIELTEMAEFAAIDELRCINNCFKHSGIVSQELSAFPGWILGQPLGNVRTAIARIRLKVPTYLDDVAHALN